MSAAYAQPYGAPPAPVSRGYAPPGAPWQNYPPPGYPQQNHPAQAQAAGLGEYVPCPRCTRPHPEQVKFTWWGGTLGLSFLKHVKCQGCGLTYNGKSGQSNTTNIVIYGLVVGLLAFAIALFFVLR